MLAPNWAASSTTHLQAMQEGGILATASSPGVLAPTSTAAPVVAGALPLLQLSPLSAASAPTASSLLLLFVACLAVAGAGALASFRSSRRGSKVGGR